MRRTPTRDHLFPYLLHIPIILTVYYSERIIELSQEEQKRAQFMREDGAGGRKSRETS